MSQTYTKKVIEWLEKQDYSNQHWHVVAQEILEQHHGNITLASSALAENLKAFHLKYQTAVVKPDNLLFDLISLCFNKIDWIQVAEHRYNQLNNKENTMTNSPQTTYLKDYQPLDISFSKIFLDCTIHNDYILIKATSTIKSKLETPAILILNGENLECLKINHNHTTLTKTQYTLTKETLTLLNISNNDTLEITTKIYPKKNTELEGIYQSNQLICSQNEPEGFRRITYYIDRPDNMAIFTTKITADKTLFPILLSNGNLIEKEELDNNQHIAIWHDPFPKPSYLYAFVAGNLAKVSDSFITKSGRKICLEIFVEHGNETQCDHAMTSLKKSMKWDEDVFGLEYDLDLFMIVAVNDFNFGAMENKGLNIFNAAYILANPKTATDTDYKNIEAVVAHEYFHNWTGNRVTCRNWFQLTLKEGLTVFRDQEFSSDMNSRSVERIQNVRILRDHQFSEDAGPMAHPIKPASYIEINNFYTPTVYNKGAEIIRMVHTLLGPKLFRKGIDIYFEHFDGQAVTTEDFIWAMQEASGQNLDTFKHWYSQAGTPTLTVKESLNLTTNTATYTFTQSCKETPETSHKKPFVIPITFSLYKQNGQRITTDQVLLDTLEKNVSFESISEKPIPSICQNFSAPVIINYNYTTENLLTLFQHDTDDFNRYEAGQRVFHQLLTTCINHIQNNQAPNIDPHILNTLSKALFPENISDPAFFAEAMTLPSLNSILQKMDTLDVPSAHKAKQYLLQQIALENKEKIEQLYQLLHTQTTYEITPNAMGKRSLKNKLLRLLTYTDNHTPIAEQFKTANNLTDQLAALSADLNTPEPNQTLTNDFFSQWQNETLVLNKWFIVQATSNQCTLEKIKTLEKNPKFDIKNPNKCRGLFGSFARNLPVFHTPKAYQYLSQKIIEIDNFNPSVAARLSESYNTYKKCPPSLKEAMKTALLAILDKPNLSKNTFEIISKTLNQ